MPRVTGVVDLRIRELDQFDVAVEGRAELVRDKAQFEAHWTKDLDIWFEDGVDTPGLTMIRVKAERIHWWDKGDEGEITL